MTDETKNTATETEAETTEKKVCRVCGVDLETAPNSGNKNGPLCGGCWYTHLTTNV